MSDLPYHSTLDPASAGRSTRLCHPPSLEVTVDKEGKYTVAVRLSTAVVQINPFTCTDGDLSTIMRQSKQMKSFHRTYSMGPDHESAMRDATISAVQMAGEVLAQIVTGSATAQWQLRQDIEKALDHFILHPSGQICEHSTDYVPGVTERETTTPEGTQIRVVVQHAHPGGIEARRTWATSPNWETCLSLAPTLRRIPLSNGDVVYEYIVSSLVVTSGLRYGCEDLGLLTQPLLEEFALSCAILLQSVANQSHEIETTSELPQGVVFAANWHNVFAYLEKRRRNLMPSLSCQQVTLLPDGLASLPEKALSTSQSIWVPPLPSSGPGHSFILTVRPGSVLARSIVEEGSRRPGSQGEM